MPRAEKTVFPGQETSAKVLGHTLAWPIQGTVRTLWCWRRLLRVPWKSNQSILKENNPEHSLEGQTLKLKLQYSGHLMRRADSLEKTLMLGKTEKRTTEDEMVGWHYLLNGQEFEQAPGDGEGQGGLACCSPGGCKELDKTE